MHLKYFIFVFFNHIFNAEAYLELCQTSKMKLFAEVVDSWKPVTISTKSFILDILTGSLNMSLYLTSALFYGALKKKVICHLWAALSWNLIVKYPFGMTHILLTHF